MEWSLQWLADNAGVTNRITCVYDLETLLSEMVALKKAGMSRGMVEDLLSTSNYERDSYTRYSVIIGYGSSLIQMLGTGRHCNKLYVCCRRPCTRCDYHEELDCSHCSLGISHTYCYVMSELLCPLYNISITRNHLPVLAPASSITTKTVVHVPSGARRAGSIPAGGPGHQTEPRAPHMMGRGTGRGIAGMGFRQPSVGRGRDL